MNKYRSNRRITVPNILTLSRIAAAPILTAAVLGGGAPWIAVTILALAAVTDLVDGPLARAMNQVSELGVILDPIADKILITTALLLLCIEGTIRDTSLVPVFVILWREFVISGLREYARGKGLVIPVSKLARYKTALQALSAILFFAARVPSSISGEPSRQRHVFALGGRRRYTIYWSRLFSADAAAIMEVTLKYFAWVRERIGAAEERVSLPDNIVTVGDVIRWLKSRGDGYEAAFEREDIIRAAVDQTHAPHGTSIKGARELAFFPPITGG